METRVENEERIPSISHEDEYIGRSGGVKERERFRAATAGPAGVVVERVLLRCQQQPAVVAGVNVNVAPVINRARPFHAKLRPVGTVTTPQTGVPGVLVRPGGIEAVETVRIHRVGLDARNPARVGRQLVVATFLSAHQPFSTGIDADLALRPGLDLNDDVTAREVGYGIGEAALAWTWLPCGRIIAFPCLGQ